MAKKESTLLNMVLTLFVITVISSLVLGFINEATIQPKAEAKLKKKIAAIASVVPEFNNNPAEEMFSFPHSLGLDDIELYPAKKDGELTGVAISSSSKKGYNGLVKIMVGFDAEGKILKVSVLEQKETPGLGTRMEENKFISQFSDIDPATFNLHVKKDGGDVDAITAATISSRAFCEAAREAFDAYKKMEKQ